MKKSQSKPVLSKNTLFVFKSKSGLTGKCSDTVPNPATSIFCNPTTTTVTTTGG